MSNNYLGEIRIFAGNFAPKGWAFCNGQLLPINQNQALFAILGTVYGGDGISTFGLPDMRGRVPMAWGTAVGGQIYDLGEKAGAESVTLIQSQMPAHNHQVMAVNAVGNVADPTNAYLGVSIDTDLNGSPIYAISANTVMKVNEISPAGGNQAHENRQPSLAITFIVALQGIFPSRN